MTEYKIIVTGYFFVIDENTLNITHEKTRRVCMLNNPKDYSKFYFWVSTISPELNDFKCDVNDTIFLEHKTSRIEATSPSGKVIIRGIDSFDRHGKKIDHHLLMEVDGPVMSANKLLLHSAEKGIEYNWSAIGEIYFTLLSEANSPISGN